MTMALAWLRSFRNTEEVVVATDSRLRFGGHWDCCPKIMPLPRKDSVICFSGNTMYAYPVMIQAVNMVNMHFKSLTRGISLTEFKSKLVEILNHMTSKISDVPPGEETPDAEFLLAGYCCHSRSFKLWKIHYDPYIKRFTFRPTKRWKGENSRKALVFSGDYEREFKMRLIGLLRQKRKLDSGGFDMEPFEILRDMIRENNHNLIGGSPQLIKIYSSVNTIPFAIHWPSRAEGELCLFGRPLLEYEKHNHLNLHPDSLEINEM
ncbi:MAG: hypothetical protein HGB26_04860 [Desulfobulbaceae bacterium]|nr:hypothetical protein [Desulfobulbaceae bacterium]